MKVLVLGVVMSFLPLGVLAADAPSIGGAASISADIKGAVINGGAASGGAKATLKQSVASVLHGSVSGSLKLNVSVKGAVMNAGLADGGAEVTACQSVGSIGSDC
jgi:hypothetical protein